MFRVEHVVFMLGFFKSSCIFYLQLNECDCDDLFLRNDFTALVAALSRFSGVLIISSNINNFALCVIKSDSAYLSALK